MVLPTTRLLMISLASMVPILVVGSSGTSLVVALIWLASVLVLAIGDASSVPSRNLLEWQRSHDTKLSLGTWNEVTLRFHNRSSRSVTVRVRDATPQLLVSRGATASSECAAGTTWTIRYEVFPVHRGDYIFGPITARFLGPLGLAWRQYSMRPDDPVKVYPNLLAIRKYEGLARRGHLQETGLRKVRRRGSGTEFERLRDYTPDDEFRRINWTATARRHSPVVMEYQAERSQNVMLLIDAGRLMSTAVPYEGELEESGGDVVVRTEHAAKAVPALTKIDHAINAALLLAYVSQEYGDRVGLEAFGDRVVRFVKPAAGRRQFLTLTEVLYNLEAQPAETDYAVALAHLMARSPRRSLVVVFTDIAHEAAAASLVEHVGHLARRHLPVIVTMRDPEIERLAAAHLTEARMVYERAVARVFLDQRDLALSRLRRGGALTLDVPADQLSPSLINRYLEIKARSIL